ncbi:MAG: hypothetical protein IKU03_01715 [Bacteroidales bacterium]|nr:hypothetical protein [Bacteroidales bacterium]
MKTKNYKKIEQKIQVAKEPSVAYNSRGLGGSIAVKTSDDVISADTETMTVDEFIGKIRKALDRRYENIQC